MSKKLTLPVIILIYIGLAQFISPLLNPWVFIPILILSIFYSSQKISQKDKLTLIVVSIILLLLFEKILPTPYKLLIAHGNKMAISVLLTAFYVLAVTFIGIKLLDLAFIFYRKTGNNTR